MNETRELLTRMRDDAAANGDFQGAAELDAMLNAPCQITTDGWCATHSTAAGPAYCEQAGYEVGEV